MANPKSRDLLTSDSDVTGAQISRRDVLKVLGIGGTLTVGTAFDTSTLGVSARQEATPGVAEAIQRRLPGGPTVEEKARELEYDVEKIFRFVADEVQYEAYAGALRGAKGTLWGMAGNSVDQALLLAALLEQALVPVRFAIGELDDEVVSKLFDSMRFDQAAADAHHERVLSRPAGTTVDRDRVTPELAELTPQQQELLRSLPERHEKLVADAGGQTTANIEMIQEALAGAGVELPEFSLDLPEREQRQHVWIQFADGPQWVDLDPSMPDSAPGVAYAKTTETVDQLPDDLFHTVTFRTVAEVVLGGEAVRQELFAHQARSAELVGVPLSLIHVRPESFKAAGVAIVEELEGTFQYIPELLIGDDNAVSGTRVTFVTGEGGLGALDAESGGNDGDTLAEWLEIDIVVPDAPPRTVVREVFDRVGIERRAEGPVMPDSVPPIQLVEVGGTERSAFLPLVGATTITVVASSVPGWYFDQDYATADSLADMALVDHGYHLLRDTLLVEMAADTGYRFYPNEPNLTAFSVVPREISGETAKIITVVDLLHRGLAAIPLDGSTPIAQPHLFAGVLGQVAERLLLEGAADLAPGGLSTSFASVAKVFEAAREEGIPLRVLHPGDSAAVLTVSDRAKARIAEALASGVVVVVPERAPEVNGAPLTGWWLLDPTTGRTTDLLETGHAPSLSEEIVITWGTWRARITAFKLGICVSMAFGIVGVILVAAVGIRRGSNPLLGAAIPAAHSAASTVACVTA